MPLRNLAHDRQAQSAAAGGCLRGTIEAVQHALALFRRNAGAVVFHHELCATVRRMARRYVHPRAARAVVERVVDQVDQQHAQRIPVAGNRRGLRLHGDAEVDALVHGRRRQLGHHISRHRIKRNRHALRICRAGLLPR